MHIKQITISNFRSFRQQGEIQAFSPGTNTVVGRNGSGKSNLFDAVQFCLLAPRFAHLRQEERQALLHEGSGAAAVNAFVEIVFDNSDHRFQQENSDEVVLRRTIGLKKDEFFLQRKRTNKSEIQSLLEGAGFSKSNPYFIVQQGKVQDLCTMSDVARLRLLKEVAGTTVYDEKKAESVAKMEENRASIESISEMLATIDQKLQELNAEKDELTAYEQLDKERKSAQYALYNVELQKARSQLEQVEQDRKAHFETLETFHDALEVTHVAIRKQEADTLTLESQRRRARQIIAGLEEDKGEAVTSHTRLELQCKELEEAIAAMDELAASNKKKLAKLEREISHVETELHTKAGLHDAAQKELDKMVTERANAVKQADALYAKQGRGQQFHSAAERDAYLGEQRSQLETVKEEKSNELAQQQETLANLRRNVTKDESDAAALQQELAQKSTAQQALIQKKNEKNNERLGKIEDRKDKWRVKEDLQHQVREARASLQSARFDTKKVMPRATAAGLDALAKIVAEERLVHGKEYFGMLMENMTLKEPKFQAAVEAAAQNSLFHVIVDSDQTAARLMKRLEDGKLGRVTFLPINQLRTDPVKYPEKNNDVTPLLDLCISYDKDVERVMQHVFSRKLLARSKETASDWSVKLQMDAITLDGDVSGRKGALTGGYIDSTRSRLGAYARQIEAQEKLSSAEAKYKDVASAVQTIEQDIQRLMQDIQRAEAEHAQLNHEIMAKESTLEQMEVRSSNHKKQIEQIETKTIPDLERAMSDLDGDIKRISDEMGTELQQTLTTEERELLVELKNLQDSLAPKIDAKKVIVDSTHSEKQDLQARLENNLLLQRRDLVNEAVPDDEGPNRRMSRGRASIDEVQARKKDDLALRSEERKGAARIVADLESRLQEARANEEEVRKKVEVAKSALEKLREKDMLDSKALDEARDKSERFLNKRTLFEGKREMNLQKIQHLGMVTQAKKFSGKSAAYLEKALDTINSKLKKYSHVNKKALDQYVKFNESRVQLLERKEELDHGAEKVQELIENLDLKKDEAINRTFRGVSGHFKDVFKELVPNGAGELILRTDLDNDTDATDLEQDSSDDVSEQQQSPVKSPAKKKRRDKSNPDVSLYRAISIKVRFTEKGENYIMSQLSGGQKAIVALALIFAIQRCDPAPFYLFDELDQALDSTYRAAVARVIEKQANSKETPTQFIVSTFRQELVKVANNCYGVSHQNKVSSLHAMPKQDAMLFIANLNQDEEAVGDVTSLATSKASGLIRESRKRKKSGSGSSKGGGSDDPPVDDEAEEGNDDDGKGADTGAAEEAGNTDGEGGGDSSDMDE